MFRAAPLGVLLSLVFPGVGQGLAGKRTRMLVWAVGAAIAIVLVTLSVWLIWLVMAVRIASAVDAYRQLRDREGARSYVLAAAAFFFGVLTLAATRFAIEGYLIPSSSMYPTLVIGDHIMVEKLSKHWHTPEPGEVVVFTQPCTGVTWVKRVIARGGDTVEVRCGTVYVDGKEVPSKRVMAHTAYHDVDNENHVSWREVSEYRETLAGRSYDVFHDASRPALEEKHEPFTLHDFPSRDRPFPPACNLLEAPRAQVPLGTIVETKPEGAATCAPQMHYVVPKGTLFVMGDNRENANDSRYWGPINEDAVIGRIIGIWLSDGEDGSWRRFGALE